MAVTRFEGLFLWGLLFSLRAADGLLNDDNPLVLPPAGSYQLRVLTPNILELTRVSARNKDDSKPGPWDFVDTAGTSLLPQPTDFTVMADGQTARVRKVGFKRRVLYAPLDHWDLRLESWLYLELETPVASGQIVTVNNPNQHLWGHDVDFRCVADPLRLSPALHVNQTGYLPSFTKKAVIGYYLGSLGELDLRPGPDSGSAAGIPGFTVIDAASSKQVYQGTLLKKSESGFPFECYQKVWEADFTELKQAGEFRLCVPGLGVSFPFRVDEGVAGAFARAYALGIYHQRCGTDNSLPYTRFTHGPCHILPAEVPDMSKRFDFVNQCLAKMTEDWKENPRHTAPRLNRVDASLHPFLNHGPVDVHGGHHDAGDYSKYTINSAAFVHHLVFAADAFPGVSSLDNLGLPESRDGKSDVLQEAKWEADFLCRMQDSDGGFYFLVYPREREYESNVLPDHGDPQIVFPKTTSATAAATAALAQCASSPTFKKQFPDAAAQYLAAAWKGWTFLQRALERFGKDGAYQKITHYGNEFMHDDELAWAACELFLASGDAGCHKRLIEWLRPADPATRRWGWWRLFDAYGCAIRSYAFGARSGRLKPDQLNPLLREECENEIAAAGEEQLQRARSSVYGTSFPVEGKRALSAGWYFSSDAAFDLAVACQLDYPSSRDPRARMREAIVSNLNYEQGCNPVNVTYLTGLGWHRQREIVDQFAMNDRRVLPPTGIPLGNVQAGFGWNYQYQTQLETYSFPKDSTQTAPYPFYDRWGDAFNLSQEFVIVNQARGLAYLAWLMAQTSLKDQKWRSAQGTIVQVAAQGKADLSHSLCLECPEIDLRSARVVWEAEGQEPSIGKEYRPLSPKGQPQWIEVEAQLPDGRRIFGVQDKPARHP
jgi:hypothetical protein